MMSPGNYIAMVIRHQAARRACGCAERPDDFFDQGGCKYISAECLARGDALREREQAAHLAGMAIREADELVRGGAMSDDNLAHVPPDVFAGLSSADAKHVAEFLRMPLLPSASNARVRRMLLALAPYLEGAR